MGIVRLRGGKSTGHCEAKALSDKEIGEPAASDMPIRHKNALWIDTSNGYSDHADEHLPGRCKHPTAD